MVAVGRVTDWFLTELGSIFGYQLRRLLKRQIRQSQLRLAMSPTSGINPMSKPSPTTFTKNIVLQASGKLLSA